MLFIMFIACNTFALLHLLPWIWPKNMHADFSFKRNTFFQISEIYTSEINHNEYISNDCLVIQLQSAVTNVSQWTIISSFYFLFIFSYSYFFFTNRKCKSGSTDQFHVCGIILPKATNHIDHAKHIKYS